MILHVCSHFGDIEVLDDGNGKARIRYFRLTPNERQVLIDFLGKHDLRLLGDEGDLIVPVSLWEAGQEIAAKLNDSNTLLTAIKFQSGRVEVSKGGALTWFKRLIGLGPKDPAPASNVVPLPPKPEEKPEAGVQVPMPKRGCPMPTVTDLKERKAAAVVRKFLSGQQVEDFDRERAFIAVGNDTGHLYRVTTRWSPLVERFGVLHDLNTSRRVCASNLKVPPSEEALSMLFAVEHHEREFLASGLVG